MTLIKHPLLDLTVPDPRQLRRISAQIERVRHKGVFVHCALGLSRSVLVAFAVLINDSTNHESAIGQIERTQPGRARHPFMQVAMWLISGVNTNGKA